MAEPVLHHYDLSPFAEKIRVLFGLKDLAWASVEAPMILPKPDLVALTGGYRRVPVLQVGADVFCDTVLIATELDRRFPAPPLEQAGTAGLGRLVQDWADRTFFWQVGRDITGTEPEAFPDAFHRDRAAMWGVAPDIERMRRAAPRYGEQVDAGLGWLDDRLAGGGFLLGPAPGLADLAVYGACWFLRRMDGPPARRLDRFPGVLRWLDRLAALGHGRRRDVTAAEAAALARAAMPETETAVDAGDRLGLAAGDPVAVRPDDYARDDVAGRLVVLTAERVAVARHHPDVGDVVVHFPRLGYRIERRPA